MYNPGKYNGKILPMKYFINLIIIGLTLVVLAGCKIGDGEISLVEPTVDQPTETITPIVPTATPTLTLTPTLTPTPTPTPIVILPPDPIRIDFETEDGVGLNGLYYPADDNPAPLIVLVHWARGDQTEWQEVAVWLQGRGGAEPVTDYNDSWKSSVWFPERTLGMPIGIFTFNLRECEGECLDYIPEEWLIDIQAAMEAAAALQGVDRGQILTGGASIGADGAVYGCSWLNQTDLGDCKGSFLLSPLSLLTLPFEEIAGDLLESDPPRLVYCLFGLRDDASVETCSELLGLTNQDYGYIDYHGFELIQTERKPHALNVLQEFIIRALIGDE